MKLSFAIKFDKVNHLHYIILLFNCSDNIDDADIDDRTYEVTSLHMMRSEYFEPLETFREIRAKP